MTRYAIVHDADGLPVVTFTATGVCPPVTYATMTEAMLALIFVYGDRADLRVAAVADDTPAPTPLLLPPTPRIES